MKVFVKKGTFLKKNFSCILVAAFIFALTPGIYAQDQTDAKEDESPPEIVGRPSGTDKLFVTFSWGACASWLTRVIDQSVIIRDSHAYQRSNFVFGDFFPGLYFGAELRNIRYFTPLLRLTAYYPLVSTFNGMVQKPNTPLHFGADFLAGLRFEYEKNVFRLYTGPALHLFFLNSDRWNYFNMGAAALGGFELLLSPRWTLLIEGAVSIDNGNLGANRLMEPFDIAWQYQIGIGARFSKKMRNGSYLFDKKNNDIENIENFHR